jgi:hypothetical protein
MRRKQWVMLIIFLVILTTALSFRRTVPPFPLNYDLYRPCEEMCDPGVVKWKLFLDIAFWEILIVAVTLALKGRFKKIFGGLVFLGILLYISISLLIRAEHPFPIDYYYLRECGNLCAKGITEWKFYLDVILWVIFISSLAIFALRSIRHKQKQPSSGSEPIVGS